MGKWMDFGKGKGNWSDGKRWIPSRVRKKFAGLDIHSGKAVQMECAGEKGGRSLLRRVGFENGVGFEGWVGGMV
jgi:hypothetical protein